MKKDDLITLKIEDMGVDGEGIGKLDGFTLFVKDAVAGDTVEAKVMKLKNQLDRGTSSSAIPCCAHVPRLEPANPNALGTERLATRPWAP